MKKLQMLFLFLSIAIFSIGQTATEKMDELVNAYVDNERFNGVVLVTKNGKPVFEKAYGLRNAKAGIQHEAGDIFQVGSVTKQFTAAVIMQLHEEGKLSVSDPLSKYFKGFKNADSITIEHLLTHTSGLFNYTDDSVIMRRDVTKHYSQAEMLEVFQNYEPVFSPGVSWQYSNTGYSLLGYIIENVTGKPYEVVVRQRIFQPLNMKQSGFDFKNLKSPLKSTGYFVLADSTIIPAPVVDSTIAYAAGAIYTTARDLSRWEKAITEGKLLQPASWKKVFTPFKSKYGYGWMIDSLHGKLAHFHGGGIHGFSSYILRIPEEKLAVVVIDNASSAHPGAIGNTLAAIALNKPYTIPERKTVALLDSEVLKEYEGEYQLAPTFSIAVFLEGDVLKGQATGQEAFTMYPEAKDKFFLKVVEARIEFQRTEAGKVKSLVLFQNGMELKGNRVDK